MTPAVRPVARASGESVGAGGGIGTIAFVFVLLIGLVVIVSLVGYLCSSVALRKQLPGTGRLWFRACIVLSICAAVCVYLWGMLHMPSDEGVYLRKACVKAGGEAKAARVDGYDTSFVPLRFVCRVDEGGSYSTIPPWINPAVGALASLALITGAAAGATREGTGRRTEQTIPKGNP
ncbi:hypothetical protein ACWZEH_08665 [Streptomyces sp. QTS137]